MWTTGSVPRTKEIIEAVAEQEATFDFSVDQPLPTSDASAAADAARCEAQRSQYANRLDALRELAGRVDQDLAALQGLPPPLAQMASEVSGTLADVRARAAESRRLESECTRLGQAAAALVDRVTFLTAQAKVREDKAASLATFACQFADDAARAGDATATRHAREASGFADQTALAADEASQIVEEMLARLTVASRLISELDGLSTSSGALDAALAAHRSVPSRIAPGLARIRESARGPAAGLQSAANQFAALIDDATRDAQSCPGLFPVADEATVMHRSLVAKRNLGTGTAEALDAQLLQVQSDVSRIELALAEMRNFSCPTAAALRTALESAAEKLSVVDAHRAVAREAATRARACADAAGRGVPPPSDRTPPGEPSVSDPRIGVAGESVPAPPRIIGPTTGAPSDGTVADPPRTDPPVADGSPRVAVDEPAGSGPGGDNPWDRAAGQGTSGTGANPWDEAARSGRPGGGSVPPSGASSGAGSDARTSAAGVDGLLGAAAGLADPPSCNYEAAATVLAQAAALAPADPRVAVMKARLSALAGGRAIAMSAYQRAQAQLAANDLGGALASARVARAAGPPCDRAAADGLIALIENAINRERVAERQRAAAESRAAAAAVLGDLINVYNRGAAAQGQAAPPPTAAGGNTGGEGAGTTGPAPGTAGAGTAGPGASGRVCSIQRASAADEPGMYWAVIAIPANAQVTNYLVMPFRSDGATPDDWVNQAGALGGAGRPQVRGRGTRAQMDALAAQLCPNPATPPAGLGLPQPPR